MTVAVRVVVGRVVAVRLGTFLLAVAAAVRVVVGRVVAVRLGTVRVGVAVAVRVLVGRVVAVWLGTIHLDTSGGGNCSLVLVDDPEVRHSLPTSCSQDLKAVKYSSFLLKLVTF